jgi:hypothetical protein
MNALEEQADNAKARELFWKPMSWLGAIRPTSANDVFDPALWATFVSTTIGVGVPVLSSLPRLHNSPLAKCGCKKHPLDLYGDHTSTCTAHSGATKAHDWMFSVLGPLSRPDTRGPKPGFPFSMLSAHSTWSDGKRRPTARRCGGDSELSEGSSREPELGR